MRARPQDDSAPVRRLYERLTEALQRTRRDPFNVPVTVAEIYQELVPYRLVRSEIGFDMNADYEHALLRLLSGEGEWLRIEPAHAVDEIRRELRNAVPNLGIYRDYAACDVWVRKPPSDSEPRGAEPGAAPAAGAAIRNERESALAKRAAPRSAPERTRAFPVSESAPGPVADWQGPAELTDIATPGEPAEAAALDTIKPAGEQRPDREAHDDERAVSVSAMSDASKREAAGGEGAAASPAKPARSAGAPRPAAPPPPAPAPAAAGRAGSAPKPAIAPAKPEAARCAFCDSQLPQQRQARFCPYCGADQTTRPCPSCGEAVEPGWAFCITCGATVQ